MGLPGHDWMWPRFDLTGGGRGDSALRARPAALFTSNTGGTEPRRKLGSRCIRRDVEQGLLAGGRVLGRAWQQKPWIVGGALLTEPAHECVSRQQSAVLCLLVVPDSRLAAHQT